MCNFVTGGEIIGLKFTIVIGNTNAVYMSVIISLKFYKVERKSQMKKRMKFLGNEANSEYDGDKS